MVAGMHCAAPTRVDDHRLGGRAKGAVVSPVCSPGSVLHARTAKTSECARALHSVHEVACL